MAALDKYRLADEEEARPCARVAAVPGPDRPDRRARPAAQAPVAARARAVGLALASCLVAVAAGVWGASG